MPNAEVFQPHKTCENRTICEMLKICVRAHLIEWERERYGQVVPRSLSALNGQVKNAKCQHPQVTEAIQAAQPLLDSATQDQLRI